MLSTNTNFFTAGIELEFKVGQSYSSLNRALQNAGFTWAKAMYDGSPAPDAEVIFAPMPVNENGIMQCAQGDVARLIEFLESEGADCPARITGLGMHTHIGNRLIEMDPAAYWQASKDAMIAGRYFQPDANQMTDTMSVALLKDVVMRYADHQSEIDAILSRSRRENGAASRWCHSIRPVGFHGAYREQFERASSVDRMSSILGSLGESQKYGAINLTHWSSKGTIEFRQHQGTLSLDKINRWIGLLVSMIQHSDQTRMKYPTQEQVQTPIMPHRPASRLGITWGMCRRAGGAHVQEIVAATGSTPERVRQVMSEWRAAHGDQAVITHTQQSYGHRYGSSNGAHDQCGYEIAETYMRGDAGDVELLPDNRAGVTSIWGGVSDDTFEWFNERRDSLRR